MTSRRHQTRTDPAEAILRRQRYLPRQIEATRRKLDALRVEAVRLGMPELVARDDEAARSMRHRA